MTLNKLVSTADLKSEEQLGLISMIRKQISGSEDPPIGQILQTDIMDVISTIFQFNDTNDHVTYMKMEVVWILTNLLYASGKELEHIFNPKYQVLNTVNSYLLHSIPAMVEQSLWFFGNAIAEGRQLRDLVVNQTCIVDVMVKMVEAPRISKTALKTIVWVCSNIFRYKNMPDDIVMKCLPIIRAGIFLDEECVVSDSLWSLSYMSDT